MAEVQQWRVVGDFLDFCKCRLPCPCTFAQPPTEGDCDGMIAYHIREGNYGDVGLDGLNLVGLGHFDGSIWDDDVKMNAGFIVDERADESQREALQLIFGGQAGGFPEVFAEAAFGEILGMEFAPIDLEIADDLASWRVEVPGKASGATTALLTGPFSPPDGRLQVIDAPGSEVGPTGGAVTYGTATTNTAEGFGFKWDWSGRSSKHIPFEWSGP
jgi:hypothetical protein